ncbi:MAG: phytanoyl-CoA dioxygenase family protein [Acidimicrobiia bacterium]|nr:phytanoyl-CoA dioxygenase family protein [Acidimicrobiia bacterium]
MTTLVQQAFELTAAEVDRFDTYGYLLLPGLFRDEIEDIRQGFDAVVHEHDLQVVRCDVSYDTAATGLHDAPRRAVLGPLDRHERLGWLSDDPRTAGIAARLIEGTCERLTDHANLFSCDVHWHHDGIFTAGAERHVLLTLYLDPLTAANGALRVIPGSHHRGPFRRSLVRTLTSHPLPPAEVFGSAPDELPAEVLDVEPGDVIVIDMKLLHASFGGGTDRRSLTIEFGTPRTEQGDRRAPSAEERQG